MPKLLFNDFPGRRDQGKAGLDGFRKAKGSMLETINLELVTFGFMPPRPRPLEPIEYTSVLVRREIRL